VDDARGHGRRCHAIGSAAYRRDQHRATGAGGHAFATDTAPAIGFGFGFGGDHATGPHHGSRANDDDTAGAGRRGAAGGARLRHHRHRRGREWDRAELVGHPDARTDR
jgi:hypothetical protein